MRTGVLLDWQVSSYTGWGIYGLNLAIAWAQDPEIEAISALEVDPRTLDLDPLAAVMVNPFLRASNEAAAHIQSKAGEVVEVQGPVMRAVNGAFLTTGLHGVRLNGRPNLAACFLEVPPEPDAIERAKSFELIVAGSSWNEQVMRAHGIERVQTVLQGVDPSLFHPAARRDLFKDHFVVFSGGKLERRKGQDLVVAAFKVFAERHPDALLITAWNSPWPEFARQLNMSGRAARIEPGPDGRLDLRAWIAANGIAPRQFLDLGMPSNATMPRILREADVALFPNRCEGGTNLVAMEAMACGVPTILSANTGHLDLIEGDNCYALTRQAPLAGKEAPALGVSGWGESDVDEILDALERAYADREDARARGLRGAATLSRMTWAETARQVKAAVLPLARR